MTRIAILLACLVGCGRVNYSVADAPGDSGIDAVLNTDIDAFASDTDADATIDAFDPADSGTDAPTSDAGPILGPLAFDHFIKASNTGPGDNYGTVIALSGDGNTLAVGAIYEGSTGVGINPPSNEAGMSNGAVYIYVRAGATWTFQAFIKASNTNTFDEFGRSVALSDDGNTLAVGAPNEDGSGTGTNPAIDEASSASGAVFVYTRSASVWSFQSYIKADNTGPTDHFGASVALDASGYFLAVGAPGEDSSGTLIDPASNESAPDSGAVYTYTRSGTRWGFGNRIKASDTSGSALFGTTVALSGTHNTLAVGAPAAPPGGAVYVYQRASTWTFQDALRGNNTGTGDLFGSALAIAIEGRTIAVGANGEATQATGIDPTPNRLAQDTGAAYVFGFDGARWRQSAFIKASNAAMDNFAWSLALDATGTYLVVGSIFEDGNGMGIDAIPGEGVQGSGAAYSFIRRGTTWEEVHYIKAFNAGMSDHFGGAVAMSRDGRTLAIGASLESSSGTGVGSTPDDAATGAGAVYLYR